MASQVPSASRSAQPAVAGVVVLAAGQGTRMRSRTPKVLHRVGGRSMLGHVLAAAAPLGAGATVVVVGSGREAVEEATHALNREVFETPGLPEVEVQAELAAVIRRRTPNTVPRGVMCCFRRPPPPAT